MKYIGLACAFMLAGAATAAELGYEAPPPEQVFTPVSAVDWTGFYFSGNATGSFSGAFSGTPFTTEQLVPFRTSGRLGGTQVYGGKGAMDLAANESAVGSSGAPTSPGDATKSGTEDPNGRRTLGVDISRVGSTPTKVRRFLVALPADAASKVRSGCAAVMSEQDNYHPALLRFCTVLPQKSVSLP